MGLFVDCFETIACSTFVTLILDKMGTISNLSLCVLILVQLIRTSIAIHCFECDSSKDFSCTEFWDPANPVNIQYLNNCSHVFEARYCIKQAGIFDGKLGTKRFCSSVDWGNYCEYIRRPGDIQDYRSCTFSCSAFSGCNSAPKDVTLSKTTAIS